MKLPRAAVVALALALVTALAPAVPAAAYPVPDPRTCAGYPEPRVFLESQAWWGEMPVRGGVGHLHLGTCFPLEQTVRGTFLLDVRLLLHENPGRAYLLRAQIDGGSTVAFQSAIDFSCAGADCEAWFRVPVDTTKHSYDGRHELRLTAKVRQPDGSTQYESTGWIVNIANGRPVKHYRTDRAVVARGWYDGTGYTNATLVAGLPAGPVSGLWRPRVTLDRGAGGAPVTHALATIDPDFHAGVRGRVVHESAGPFRGELAVDTRALPNGRHRLVLVAAASGQQPAGTSSGVLVVPFHVAN